MIEKRSGQVVSVVGETVQLMDLESYETFETEMPKEGELKGKLTPGAEIEYWKVFDRIKLARVK
jgi:translation initiation factor 5A